MRLLTCLDCKTIEPLHDFDGPSEYDMELEALVEKHQSAGMQHYGSLSHVPDDVWEKDKLREGVLAEMRAGLDRGSAGKPGSGEGLGEEAYNLKHTFQDDAMTCWGKHLRNPACNDYKSDDKRILPNTYKERREAGLLPLSVNNPNVVRYICEYCPVHSLVVQAQREKAGMYK